MSQIINWAPPDGPAAVGGCLGTNRSTSLIVFFERHLATERKLGCRQSGVFELEAEVVFRTLQLLLGLFNYNVIVIVCAFKFLAL